MPGEAGGQAAQGPVDQDLLAVADAGDLGQREVRRSAVRYDRDGQRGVQAGVLQRCDVCRVADEDRA
jgi:hypothetical protein